MLKLGQEHAILTGQDILLLKLDFEKAFDRVDHDFLWATLLAMNLDPFVLSLIQGLVLNAEAKVHVNGSFTPSFPLERGVRQGDPLAPLLFVLTTEPLMRLLQKKCDQGDLVGLRVTQQESLLFQLFADDSCLFIQNSQTEFERAREAVQIFENISGACLNVCKSVIIPLTNPRPQLWHQSTGCKILKDSETTVYLGCLIGYHVTPLQETKFLLGKVRKRLSHWANRCL